MATKTLRFQAFPPTQTWAKILLQWFSEISAVSATLSFLGLYATNCWARCAGGNISRDPLSNRYRVMQTSLDPVGWIGGHKYSVTKSICFSYPYVKVKALALTLSIYGSIALVDLGRFFSFLTYTQSIGLLWRGISPSQSRYIHTEQHKHRINAHGQPRLEWDSNPRSQCSIGRRQFVL
jgi:hypothetical protein